PQHFLHHADSHLLIVLYSNRSHIHRLGLAIHWSPSHHPRSLQAQGEPWGNSRWGGRRGCSPVRSHYSIPLPHASPPAPQYTPPTHARTTGAAQTVFTAADAVERGHSGGCNAAGSPASRSGREYHRSQRATSGSGRNSGSTPPRTTAQTRPRDRGTAEACRGATRVRLPAASMQLVERTWNFVPLCLACLMNGCRRVVQCGDQIDGR
ncbi:hypothetical protein B0H14DRAFT_2915726, partial [Mycena olivaceomarginata]